MRPIKSVLSLVSLLLITSPTFADPGFPGIIELPLGFRPEGIEHGHGNFLYVANSETGAVYRANAHTGKGKILVPPQDGRNGLGIHLDTRTNYLFNCGGRTGHAFVYDANSGHNVADIPLNAPNTSFINDDVITPTGVYFTDSFMPVLYRVALGADGSILDQPVQTIPLTGDFVFTPGQFNSNGIVLAGDGKLILVNSFSGSLFHVDPVSGHADKIDTGGEVFMMGDGLAIDGHTLYIVQNNNRVDILTLSADFEYAHLDRVITDPRFEILATGVLFAGAIYVTNPRFDVPTTPTTEFRVVRVDLQ